MATPAMQQPRVVTREEWLAARRELLAKEKQLTPETDFRGLASQTLVAAQGRLAI